MYRWEEVAESAQKELEHEIPDHLALESNLQASLSQGLERIWQTPDD